MLQNPHRQPASCATSPTRPGRRADWREKTRPAQPLHPRFREKLARHAINRQLLAIVRAQRELLRARAHIRPSRAKFFAHEARQRGDVETNNTTARPQQGTSETGITSAPENCTKNAHFAPAKAMAVSVEARPAPAKAMTVSIEAPSAPAKAMAVSVEALRRPEHQRGNKHQHAARTARGRATAHGHTKQPGPPGTSAGS